VTTLLPQHLAVPSPRQRKWPSVGVVIPTRNRPQLLRRALRSVLAQDYPGPLRAYVVFDQTEPDWSLNAAAARSVMVLSNLRTPGLAGARNRGILAAHDCELIAFCDDDDAWMTSKLTAQVSAMRARRGTLFATCAIEVEYNGRRVPRLAGRSEVGVAELARSRMAMLHSSSFVVLREALVTEPAAGGIGLVAEDAPGSQNEDWDLLLRAAKRAAIVHVDAPLVRVLWGRSSLFTHEYETKISSLLWMMQRHPEIGGCRPGAARVYGQMACWEAAQGNRAEAWKWARAAVRNNWHEPRAAIAMAAAAGVVKVDRVLDALHRHGRGI
jgi:glycosyltransferase involved in cell wall biosynthesis